MRVIEQQLGLRPDRERGDRRELGRRAGLDMDVEHMAHEVLVEDGAEVDEAAEVVRHDAARLGPAQASAGTEVVDVRRAGRAVAHRPESAGQRRDLVHFTCDGPVADVGRRVEAQAQLALDGEHLPRAEVRTHDLFVVARAFALMHRARARARGGRRSYRSAGDDAEDVRVFQRADDVVGRELADPLGAVVRDRARHACMSAALTRFAAALGARRPAGHEHEAHHQTEGRGRARVLHART